MFRRVICAFRCYLYIQLDASAPNLKLAEESFHVDLFVGYILLILKILIEYFSTNLIRTRTSFLKFD